MTDAPNFTTQAIDWLQSQRSYEEHVQTLVELLAQAHAQGRQEGFAEARERAVRECANQEVAYGSDEYATGQPVSSIAERVACQACANAIMTIQPTNDGSASDG